MELNPHVVRSEAIKVGSYTKKLQLQSNIKSLKKLEHLIVEWSCLGISTATISY